MQVKLINSIGCELDQIDGDQNAVNHRILCWMETIQEGDKIVFVTVDEDDPLDDFNYVGSRHHY